MRAGAGIAGLTQPNVHPLNTLTFCYGTLDGKFTALSVIWRSSGSQIFGTYARVPLGPPFCGTITSLATYLEP